MSTRVQKGSTVFRPVAKTRPRPTESISTPSISQVSHPQLEAHRTPFSGASESTPAVVNPQPPTVLSHLLQGRIDYAVPAVIVNTAKQGVLNVVSSARPVDPRLPVTVEETSTPATPSRVEAAIVEQNPQHPTKRRSRSRSLASGSPKKSRKGRRTATPALGVDADPGEDLDPTAVTMAALCEDTGQGRVSSKATQIQDNHLAWKKSNKDKRARMRTRMEARKYGRNEDSDNAQANRREGEPEQTPTDAMPGLSSQQSTSANLDTVGDTSGQGFDYSQNVSTSRYNVQVRIGPSGETIVDEESLFVDRTAEEDTTEYTHVEESDVTKFVNSATYSKRFRGSRWSAQETESFYNALSQFGENYELISYVLPGRDRKACKNKFKSEDRKNPQRIDYYLKNRKPYDMQALSSMTGKDFSGPTPEIRPPVVLSLGEPGKTSESDQPPALGLDEGPSSPTAKHVEEVVGDLSSFNSIIGK